MSIEAYTTLKTLMEHYQSSPKEEDVYHIENFKVESNTDQYRVTSHQFKLRIHQATVFKKLDLQIAPRGYHFIPIKSIQDQTTINPELIGMLYVNN